MQERGAERQVKANRGGEAKLSETPPHGGVRRSMARLGETRRDEARRGETHETRSLCLALGKVWLGLAWPNATRRGLGRKGGREGGMKRRG